MRTQSQLNPVIDLRSQADAFARLRDVTHALQQYIYRHFWTLTRQKRKHMKIPTSYRDKIARTLYRLLVMFFQEGQGRAKIVQARIQEQATSPVDIVAQKVLRSSYAKTTRNYKRWIKTHAWKLERKRFKDTVIRAENVMKVAVEQGLTRTQAQVLLVKSFRKYNTYELDRVITTEHTRMVTLGQLNDQMADETIVGFQSRVNYVGCPICDGIEQEGVQDKDKIDERPPYHPNCQCTLEPVFDWEIN